MIRENRRTNEEVSGSSKPTFPAVERFRSRRKVVYKRKGTHRNTLENEESDVDHDRTMSIPSWRNEREFFAEDCGAKGLEAEEGGPEKERDGDEEGVSV